LPDIFFWQRGAGHQLLKLGATLGLVALDFSRAESKNCENPCKHKLNHFCDFERLNQTATTNSRKCGGELAGNEQQTNHEMKTN